MSSTWVLASTFGANGGRGARVRPDGPPPPPPPRAAALHLRSRSPRAALSWPPGRARLRACLGGALDFELDFAFFTLYTTQVNKSEENEYGVGFLRRETPVAVPAASNRCVRW
jgi:hypothetical protein